MKDRLIVIVLKPTNWMLRRLNRVLQRATR
jgi:hypothetical protein